MTKTSFSHLTVALLASTILTTDIASAAIDEVIVSTRKRDESLQSLPLSVSVLTAESIQKLGINDIKDVARITPGVIFDDGFGLNDQRFVIRGLSPSRGRANSAVLIDGIDFTTQSLSSAGGGLLFDQRLLDIQNIEIVKGPQSALYGRAAFGGAIQYVTKDPGEEFGGNASVDIGEYGRYSLSGSVSGPVSDSFAFGVNALYWEEDGFYTDALTGGPLGGGEGYGIGATAVWDATDSFKVKARLSYAEDEFDPQAIIFFRANTTLPVPSNAVLAGVTTSTTSSLFTGQVNNMENAVTRLSRNPRTGQAYEGGERETLSFGLTADWDVGIGTISSLTGYMDGKSGQSIDGDQDSVPDATGRIDIARGGAELISDMDTEVISQELRFASNLDGPLQFTVGALYWQERVSQVSTSVVVLPLGPVAAGYNNSVVPITAINPENVSRDTDHWSIYGLAEWDINEQWKATVEGRYAHEEATIEGPSCGYLAPLDFLCGFAAPTLAVEFPPGVFNQPPTFQARDKISDNYFAPKGILEWTPNDDVLIYGSIAQGIKPAGISTVSGGGFLDADSDLLLEEAKFDAEKLLTYELGAKTSWFDNTLQLNGAVFFQDYTDKQIPIRRIVGGFPIPFVENAGEAEVFGVELDAQWKPTENLTLQLVYAYLDGEYTDFVFETDSASNIARAGNCVVTPDGLCSVSLTGKKMEDIPEHSISASVGFRAPLSNTGLDWFVEGNWQYQDERYADEYNDRGVDAFQTTDLRAGLDGENWNLLFYVNNVFDDDSFQNWTSGGGGIVETAELLSFFPSSGYAFSPDPRHVGVRASFDF